MFPTMFKITLVFDPVIKSGVGPNCRYNIMKHGGVIKENPREKKQKNEKKNI